MRLYTLSVLALSLAVHPGCSGETRDSAERTLQPSESLRTDLTPASCRKEIDKSDPNETPYLVCAGAGAYELIVRRVDAGRHSIDVLGPGKRAFPLNLHEVVTRHMFSLGETAEWRVAATGSGTVPLALLVRVEAREDTANPEEVTRSYIAIAKITPETACVTDRIIGGTRSEADVRRAADTARERPCAPPQPPMVVDGAVVR